jgi:amino acid adenylation domain-containing protein
VIADHFRLPAARIGGESVRVRHGDLAGGLARFGVEFGVVLAAAHVKVLSMLTEERTFRTDLGRSAVHTLTVRWAGVSTWRQLVEMVQRAERSVAGPGEPDRVLFSTGEAAGDRYGLCVRVRNDAVVLTGGGDLDRLAALYRGVLAAMAADPDGDAVAACLPPGERRSVLHDWAVGPVVERSADTVVDLFRAQAARTPDAPAVEAVGTVLSYRELDQRSNQIARYLLDLGARPETLIGVCLRRTADLLPVLFGVWKSGAGYLPLDAGLPAQRLRRMVAAAKCDLVLTSTGLPATGFDDVRVLMLDDARTAIAAQPKTQPGVRVGPASLAYVMFTSGSTGDPRGVLVQHGNLANYLHWTVAEYAARGTGGSAFFTSIGFDLGLPSLFTPLLTGQRVKLLPDPLDTADLPALLAAGAPYSFLKMTPGHLNLLSFDLGSQQAHDLAGVVIAAGDAFPYALARRWAELAGPGGTAVATEYGPTEITVGNSGQLITDFGADGLTPLGRPIPNTTMYLLNDDLEPVPIGVPGEVWIGGAGVSRGYLDEYALTADRFRPDPYGPPGARLYRTGDRGRRRRGGSLEFLGRTDHQVKIRGYRVEPGEIQETLRRHPGVGAAVVIVQEQPPRPPYLAAFVLPAAGRELDVPRLRADLAAELPGHLVPAEIVAVSAIPLTANGKVDIRALRAGSQISVESGR